MLLLTALAALLWISSPAATAGELIYSQYSDNQSAYGPSQLWTADGVNSEVADDFNLAADIDRVSAWGFTSGAVNFQGIYVRFYEFGSDNKPGALEHEYFFAPGDPNVVFNELSGAIDATLSPTFHATGRHFLSVQPVMNHWYWRSARSGAPRGEAFYFRDNALGKEWHHGDKLNFNITADVVFDLYGVVTRQISSFLRADCSLTSTGNIPLNDLGPGSYQGFTAGLYPASFNMPPAAHAAAALAIATDQIKPLDTFGNPDSGNGKIVMISIGMSNATQEFASKGSLTFKARADADPAKNPQLVIVDGAQNTMDAPAWIDPNAPTWSVVNMRLFASGVTPQQVQVAWLKEALVYPSDYGAFPAHAQALQADLEIILRNLKTNFHNIKIAYLSTRTRAYSLTVSNPEPFAYETGFAVKWTVENQINGTGNLNFDSAKGPVVAPLALWGPYIWADGLNARSDGFTWLCYDVESDLMHPSAEGGVPKVAEQLLAFFKTDPTATPWFLKQTVTGEPPTVTAGASVSSGDAPLSVNFTSSAIDSDGTIAAYQWTFDDGTFSTKQNPTKTFPAPGYYSVHLTITDNSGNTVLRSLPISVALPQNSATPTPASTPGQTPAAPTSLSATAISSSEIALSWTDNSMNESGFQIQRSGNDVTAAIIAIVPANITTYTDNGRTPGMTYYYRVGAYNSSGSSAPSNVASATTLAASSPTPTPTSTPTPLPLVSISGAISYCSNPLPRPVPNVTLNLTGDTTASALTDSSGNYTFISLGSGGNYTVTPAKAALTPGSAGINTLDVIAIQRHFLVIGTLLTGCKLTAADVNGAGGINTLDVIAVQRFFLGQVTGTANTGKYQFNPMNRIYAGIVTNQTSQNYDALVLGDVASVFIHRPDGPSQDGVNDDTITGEVSADSSSRNAVAYRRR